MKKNIYIFIFIFIFVSLPFYLYAETRGLTINIKTPDGKSVDLYNGSFALIIGASNYTEGWPKLPGVKKDVDAVKAVLEEQGFHVTVVMDPKKDQMVQAFENFINKYGQDQDNRLLFYFAGHGYTVKMTYGEEMGYIVPVDAPNPHNDQNRFLSTAMDMQLIEVFAKRIQSKHALFLFDSCFSGSLFALSRAVPESISYKTARPVRQFITSGGADEQVPDTSIFRQQFISALKGETNLGKDGYITGTALGEYLQDSVVNYSKGAQHPQYGKIRNPNLDKGDFVFVLNKTNDEQSMFIIHAEEQRVNEERKSIKKEKEKYEHDKVVYAEREKEEKEKLIKDAESAEKMIALQEERRKLEEERKEIDRIRILGKKEALKREREKKKIEEEREKIEKKKLYANLPKDGIKYTISGGEGGENYHNGLKYLSSLEFRKARDKFADELNSSREGPFHADADKAWKKTDKIVRAMAGITVGDVGKQIAVKDSVTRADLAALLIDEMKLDKLFAGRIHVKSQIDKMKTEFIPADVLNHSFKEEILTIMKWKVRGLEPKYDTATKAYLFKPTDVVKRGEMAFILEDVLIKLTGDEKLVTAYFFGQDKSPYPDVKPTSPFYNAVMNMTSRGIMEGELSGEFRIDAPVDGAEALLALRVLKQKMNIY